MSNGDGLPKGWCSCMLGDVLRIIRGVSYNKSQASSVQSEDRIPIIRATNIERELDFNDFVFVPKTCVSEEQLLQRGDIVIAASSGSRNVVGKAAQLRHKWTGSFGAFCMGLRVRPEIASSFVAWFCRATNIAIAFLTLRRGQTSTTYGGIISSHFPFGWHPRTSNAALSPRSRNCFPISMLAWRPWSGRRPN